MKHAQNEWNRYKDLYSQPQLVWNSGAVILSGKALEMTKEASLILSDVSRSALQQ